MGKTLLVEPDIDAGEALVRALDAAGVQVDAAFWLLASEDADWTLYVASPLVEQRGPYEVYSKIRSVIRKATPPPEIRIDHISAVGSNDRMVRLIQAAIRTGKGALSQIRFRQNVVNGTYIEDAIIYRS